MQSIKLTQGKFALVDDEDFNWLSQYKWSYSKPWYAKTSKNYKRIYLHRLIMNAPKNTLVDHINHNTLDNRRENLRLVSKQQNAFNSIKRENTSSKYKGVCWVKRERNWLVSIRFGYKNIRIGQFENERHAGLAYDLWTKEIQGEFALLNFKSI